MHMPSHDASTPTATAPTPPGEGHDIAKMPGHWVLARLGKRVLRPGGMGLTHWLIDTLDIAGEDDVVEFAPGMGRTAQLVLTASRPATPPSSATSKPPRP